MAIGALFLFWGCISMTYIDRIDFSLISIGLLLCILFVLVSHSNRSRFSHVCEMYQREFGSVPKAVKMLIDTNVIGFSEAYAIKVQFIIRPVLFGRKSTYSKFNDVKFMQDLPNNLKNWFILEYLLSVTSLILFAISGIYFYFR